MKIIHFIFLFILYVKTKEILKQNVNNNTIYTAKTVELDVFDELISVSSDSLPFFIAKSYTNQSNGYSFFFDLQIFTNKQNLPVHYDYTIISLILNPLIINGTVVKKSDFEEFKAQNFTQCDFNIPGIFDSTANHGTLFFSVDNITTQFEEVNYLIVKIDLDRRVYNYFQTKNIEFKTIVTRIYDEQIYIKHEQYYSSHIFNQNLIGKPYITTFYLIKKAKNEDRMLIEFSKRSKGLDYKISCSSGKGYEILGKNETLGREIIYININNLEVGDSIIFSVFNDKPEEYKFDYYTYCLLEDFSIKYELYDNNDDLYEYRIDNEVDIDPYQEDNITDSHLSYLFPLVKQYKLGEDSKGVPVNGKLTVKVYYLSEKTDIDNGIMDYMNSINPQILKPFYTRDFTIEGTEDYFINETERIFKYTPGYFLVDAVFKSKAGDHFHYPIKDFELNDLGKPKEINEEITYLITEKQPLYGHFMHDKNQGFLSLQVDKQITNNFLVIFAHYYEDVYGPIELVLFDKEHKKIKIIGETEFSNSIYIPYKDFYDDQQMSLRITCVRECNIVLESLFTDYYTDYYDSNFFYTLEVSNTLKITYISEYYKYHPVNVIIFSDLKLPNVTINKKEITDQTVKLENDFFKCVFLDLTKFQSISGMNQLSVEIDSVLHTNISIYQNYRDYPQSVNWTSKYGNSTPTIYNYVKEGEICDKIILNPLMKISYVIRVLCDRDAYFQTYNSAGDLVDYKIKGKEMHVLKYPDVAKISKDEIEYCIRSTDTQPLMYSLQVITNRDQQNSFATMDSLYLNVLYEDYLSAGGVRVICLGELSGDPKLNYFYNITLKEGKGIDVYRDICETYPVCVYNVSILKQKKVDKINVYKKTQYLDLVKHDKYPSLDPTTNYVYIVVCNEPHTGCLYEFEVSETTKTKLDFDSHGISKWVIILLVILVLLGAGFAVYWFYFRKIRHEIRISKLQEDIENIDKRGINENASEM
jgi:hypothetical protein